MDNAIQKDEIIEQLRDKIHIKDQRIEQFENLLKQARQQHFGVSSEKLSPDQIALFNEFEAEVSDTENQKITIPSHTRSKTKKRVSTPNDIPHEEIIYDLSDAEKICPHDGATLKETGEETHEQLEIIPAQVKVLRHMRKKYASLSVRSI